MCVCVCVCGGGIVRGVPLRSMLCALINGLLPTGIANLECGVDFRLDLMPNIALIRAFTPGVGALHHFTEGAGRA